MSNIDSGTVDFGGFLTLIKEKFDSSRVLKALSMLKKERFELFTEQNDAGTWGIIKSQTDPDLIYGCKFGAEGTFSCCTQNLNPCGGLRGALCKHILCLVIGLVKAEKIDPSAATRRIIASKRESPSLDKPVMTDLFIKYAGAAAGNVDWRPTETIPEDYYAF